MKTQSNMRKFPEHEVAWEIKKHENVSSSHLKLHINIVQIFSYRKKQTQERIKQLYNEESKIYWESIH